MSPSMVLLLRLLPVGLSSSGGTELAVGAGQTAGASSKPIYLRCLAQ
jgi:hypothetical protein